MKPILTTLILITLTLPCWSQNKEIFTPDLWSDSANLRKAIERNPSIVKARNRGETERHKLHRNGWTLLHFSSRWGREYCARVLVQKGADPNAKGDDGSTPLHCAAEHGDDPVVKVLLAAGANPNAVNKWGLTPVHTAANHGGVRALKALLAAGGNTTLRTKKHGRTPLEVAVAHHQDGTARVLREYQAQDNSTTARSTTRTPRGRFRLDTSSPVAAATCFYDGLDRGEDISLWGLLTQQSRNQIADQMGKRLPKQASRMQSLMGSDRRVAGAFWKAMRANYLKNGSFSQLNFTVQQKSSRSALVRVSGGGQEVILKTFNEGGRWRVGIFETAPFDLGSGR